MTAGITDKKYLNSLQCMQDILNRNNIKSIYKLVDDQKINAYWSRFLVKHNIVYMENGFFRWNEKIPPSSKLVQKFREEFTIKYKRYKIPKQQIPVEIKRRKRNPVEVTVINDQPRAELGLIRRFLKWIY